MTWNKQQWNYTGNINILKILDLLWLNNKRFLLQKKTFILLNVLLNSWKQDKFQLMLRVIAFYYCLWIFKKEILIGRWFALVLAFLRLSLQLSLRLPLVQALYAPAAPPPTPTPTTCIVVLRIHEEEWEERKWGAMREREELAETGWKNELRWRIDARQCFVRDNIASSADGTDPQWQITLQENNQQWQYRIKVMFCCEKWRVL